MRELKFLVETDWALGNTIAAERVLRVLANHPGWAPGAFGTQEPLRDRFDPHAPDAFVAAWSGGALNRRMGSFHFQNRQRYQASVLWWSEGNSLDSMHFTFRIQGHGDRVAQCLGIAHDLFEAVNGQYGHLCYREEYWSKNVIDAWVGRSGRPEGGKAQGTDRREHLPGVYWANFFGPAYMAFFGEDRLESAPAYAKRRGRSSWVLLTSESPDEWSAAETVKREEALRDHLGSDAFFRLGEPNRLTRAPRIVRVRRGAT